MSPYRLAIEKNTVHVVNRGSTFGQRLRAGIGAAIPTIGVTGVFILALAGVLVVFLAVVAGTGEWMTSAMLVGVGLWLLITIVQVFIVVVGAIGPHPLERSLPRRLVATPDVLEIETFDGAVSKERWDYVVAFKLEEQRLTLVLARSPGLAMYLPRVGPSMTATARLHDWLEQNGIPRDPD